MVQQEIWGKYLLHCFSVMGSFIDSTIGSILGGFQNPYNLIGSVGIRLGPFTHQWATTDHDCQVGVFDMPNLADIDIFQKFLIDIKAISIFSQFGLAISILLKKN